MLVLVSGLWWSMLKTRLPTPSVHCPFLSPQPGTYLNFKHPQGKKEEKELVCFPHQNMFPVSCPYWVKAMKSALTTLTNIDVNTKAWAIPHSLQTKYSFLIPVSSDIEQLATQHKSDTLSPSSSMLQKVHQNITEYKWRQGRQKRGEHKTTSKQRQEVQSGGDKELSNIQSIFFHLVKKTVNSA